MLDWIKNREPVIVAAVAGWVITNVGALILGHTTWITPDQWNSLATWLTPLVSAGVAWLLAWLVRRVVTPVAKVADQVEAQLGAAPGIGEPPHST